MRLKPLGCLSSDKVPQPGDLLSFRIVQEPKHEIQQSQLREKVFLQNPTQNDCVLRRSRSRALGDPRKCPVLHAPPCTCVLQRKHLWFGKNFHNFNLARNEFYAKKPYAQNPTPATRSIISIIAVGKCRVGVITMIPSYNISIDAAQDRYFDAVVSRCFMYKSKVPALFSQRRVN